MMTPLLALIPLLQLPPPPGSDTGGGSDAWWRIVGVLLVTAATIGIFAWLFRPGAGAVPAEATDGDRSATDLPAPNVVPFREPDRDQRARANAQTAAAASERLRRLTNPTQPPPAPIASPGRRRLGSRRTWVPEPVPLAENRPQEPNSVDEDVPVEASSGKDSTMEQTPTPETSLPPIGTPAFGPPSGEDLLGDLVKRLPSVEDEIVLPFKTMSGEHPTEQDVQRMGDAQPDAGKIVQFVPRQPKDAVPPIDEAYAILEDLERIDGPTRLPVDQATRQAITTTVQELLFCANVGEFMHGFALYTDRYLFQFMTESGFTELTFRDTFSDMPGKEPQNWTRIERFDNVQRQDDGRITAEVVYLEQGRQTAPERFTFKQDHITHRWLIDGITAI